LLDTEFFGQVRLDRLRTDQQRRSDDGKTHMKQNDDGRPSDSGPTRNGRMHLEQFPRTDLNYKKKKEESLDLFCFFGSTVVC
jgi:hypothetical protein